MALNFCNNNSLSAITSLPAAISGGSLNLISTQTASSSSTITITSGIDSTYKEYIIKFINIHGSANYTTFGINFSIDGGSNYNTTKTTSAFSAYHSEGASYTNLGYSTGGDLAQSTGDQKLNVGDNTGIDDDESLSGTVHLFDPSNTTFVKHFIATTNMVSGSGEPHSVNSFVAGYINSTSAVNAVRFQMASGNIDSGVIKLYGVS
tara:strand:+ start:1576 stop:2193 length:618 start_codon:yes stop_codon:yes gene_type:complete